MEIETAAPIIINDRERSRVVLESSRRKKRKADNSGKSTEKETTNVNNVDEKQISEEDFGDWVDEETVRIMIEKLNEKYDDFGFIDDEKLRDEARAYHQRRIDNPFDIDDLPPPPIPDYFETLWSLDPSSWRWERAKELMHYAVHTEQDKKEEYSTYQTTVCDDINPSGYGSIDVEIFQRKGQAPAAVIGP